LTNKFSESRSFMIKSTSPFIVGNDSWSSLVPLPPTKPSEDATPEEKIAYEQAYATYIQQYNEIRSQYDRIAYAGQTPVNVTGATAGDYIIASEGSNDTIVGIVVPKNNTTFEQYQNAVGRVIKILEDGRAYVNVIVH
jgi:hypothetical protein